MAEIVQLPENNGGMGGVTPVLPIGGNSGGPFGNGQTNLMDLLGFAIIASMFPNMFGNRGNINGMNGDLAIQAVTAQGEASRTAIQTLASSVGQDFNIVYGAVSNVQNLLSSLASANGMGFLQVINSLQSGNAALSQQFCQCCCDARLLTTEQGYQAQIRTIEQTNQLGSQADRNTASIVGAISSLQTNMTKEFCDVKEREMQEKINTQSDIITQLRGQIDNVNQTNQIIGYVNSVVAPLQKSVTEIENKMPNTVPVQWPQLTAVNTTPYVSGGFYGQGWNGFYGGNGFGGNIVF